ncbi:hypothetical protein PC121_g20745 [Phytophthora cactorum]|nr:hypothetical protein PC120_g21556 [Phytophthora cactorum]KAG3046326.1 hypothetical protein PC121_g20745 [Phytophthora cactorum]
MPRESKRSRLLREYAVLLDRWLQVRKVRLALGVKDQCDDELDDFLLARVQAVVRARYLSPRVYLKRVPRFSWVMTECSDREFLRSFRMERGSFAKLVNLIKESPAFAITLGKRRMAAAACQLMVFLKFIGTHGSDACVENLSAIFNVASGACFDYIERVTSALLELYDDVVGWPTADERKKIAKRVCAGYDFPHCVGVMDGTLIPLAFQPILNGEDYYTRKGSYALNALICCDGRAKVTYALTGWPGCTHDNRVWSNFRICRSPESFFSQSVYLLTDSAFRASRYVVPPFKNLPGAAIALDQDFFNTKLANIRIRTEHCIGLFKGRLQHFKGVCVLIRSRGDLVRIIRLFCSSLVIHNLLIHDPIPAELDEDSSAEVEKEISHNDGDTSGEDSTWEGTPDRRDQLFHFLVENDGRF